MEFTNEEKHRIDVLYGGDFKDITPADVPLIQRWEKNLAENSAEMQAKREAMEHESQAKIEQSVKTETLARAILEEQASKARQRWELLRYGKKEQV